MESACWSGTWLENWHGFSGFQSLRNFLWIRIKPTRFKSSSWRSYKITDMQEKMKARLRESRLLAPSGRGRKFTQPSLRLFLHICTFPLSIRAGGGAAVGEGSCKNLVSGY